MITPDAYLDALYPEPMQTLVTQILEDLREVFVIVPRHVDEVTLRQEPRMVETNTGMIPAPYAKYLDIAGETISVGNWMEGTT